jgi:hypothetical protein
MTDTMTSRNIDFSSWNTLYMCMCMYVCVCVCVFICLCVFINEILMSAEGRFKWTVFSNFLTKSVSNSLVIHTCYMLEPALPSLFDHRKNTLLSADHLASHLSNSTSPPLFRPSKDQI